ncbi:hypothetical protein I0P70_07065 [Pontibacter sp. FD36]|uniref:hypothetical protein n=1 Tax=Pontibacter sp. FD36 TaxID=2789860 RepID=UPI0018A9FF94|nr:hypothetical protein [Pontibacter sp. FD36]MBF8962998.1 hypothetical protein [Pontibacter sp. FD36]
MAKGTDIDAIVETLQQSQQNKELLDAMVSQLEKFVINQKIVLNEIETLITQAKEGKVEKRSKRGGYRGRKKKDTDQITSE